MNSRPPRRRPADPARSLAYGVLRSVSADDAYANLILPARLRRAGLHGRDAAFATELTYGTLRGQGFYDAVIDAAATPGSRIDPEVRDALRLGAHQLLGMRVAAHAAVDSTVGLVRYEVSAGPARFANAVLRRIAERSAEEWRQRVTEGKSDLDALAITGSHPAWILRAFRQALVAHGSDPSELAALVEADNAAPDPVLAALPGLIDPAELPGETTGLSPVAKRLRGQAPADLPAVAAGRARVQDEGSQLVPLALAHASSALDEEREWLDLCAGPGGKSALLAAIGAGRSVTLTAVEPSEHRARLVRDSLRALEGWEVHEADGREFGAANTGRFSRVLVDVPCTGLGALRRRPESRWRRSPKDLPQLAPLQRELLAAGLNALAPGGVLAYATCSPHPAETIAVVDDVLGRQGGEQAGTQTGPAVLEVLDAPAVLAEVTGSDPESFASVAKTAPGQEPGPDGAPATGRLAQLWPHRHGTDGMFLALLRKR
ncbi:RsmB/NOP family class I SAM-dependent RNA methyltransferase [Sediminivirga luteola]|uniref:RsmB/NOP family class I SAM-dependent RNA methyltransferase n=1 Tax=Sediminivirga luteola TaxID=1774748 RepID=UPI001F5630CD|nr:RsmB/NOP family class I SAM-dependent RNA methyltransferase [Sediminivirga luteola]MCI2264143.1 RsmB/NOP family class I SAM-dependent RNA methyltransferase [Sediminivirga luteola]